MVDGSDVGARCCGLGEEQARGDEKCCGLCAEDAAAGGHGGFGHSAEE